MATTKTLLYESAPSVRLDAQLAQPQALLAVQPALPAILSQTLTSVQPVILSAKSAMDTQQLNAIHALLIRTQLIRLHSLVFKTVAPSNTLLALLVTVRKISCLACDPACSGCSGPSHQNCNDCAPSMLKVESTNTCVSVCSNYAANYYEDGEFCRECDPKCATCSG